MVLKRFSTTMCGFCGTEEIHKKNVASNLKYVDKLVSIPEVVGWISYRRTMLLYFYLPSYHLVNIYGTLCPGLRFNLYSE
jgi:hypothetical protein